MSDNVGTPIFEDDPSLIFGPGDIRGYQSPQPDVDIPEPQTRSRFSVVRGTSVSGLAAVAAIAFGTVFSLDVETRHQTIASANDALVQFFIDNPRL